MTNNNPESQRKCCEKCGRLVPQLGGAVDMCMQVTCSCHSPAPSQSVGWEEEFDVLLNRIPIDGIHSEDFEGWRGEEEAINELKSFISSLLTQKEQEERERVLRDSHSLEALGYTVGKKEGFNDGLREERERVLEMIEGMRKEIPSEDREDEATRNEVLNEYNQALQDLRDRITKSN